MRGSLIALAGVETRRLLRHPLMAAGVALGVVAIVTGARRDGQTQSFLLMGLAVLPLALGTFAAANLATLRARRDGSEELLDTLPQDVRTRTAAQLLAVLATLPLVAALLAGAYLLFGTADGLIIGADGTRRTPAAVELAQGPLLVLSLGAVGVFLGRVAPITALGLMLVVVVVFAEVPLAAWAPDTPLRWTVPLVNDMIAIPDTWGPCEPHSVYDCGTIERFDTAAMAWHLVALTGVAAAAAAAALLHGRGVRAGLAGAAVALVALTAVVPA